MLIYSGHVEAIHEHILIIALYSVYMLNLGLGPVFLDLLVNAEPFVSTPLELRISFWATPLALAAQPLDGHLTLRQLLLEAGEV